jgi:hypothetical protein
MYRGLIQKCRSLVRRGRGRQGRPLQLRLDCLHPRRRLLLDNLRLCAHRREHASRQKCG